MIFLLVRAGRAAGKVVRLGVGKATGTEIPAIDDVARQAVFKATGREIPAPRRRMRQRARHALGSATGYDLPSAEEMVLKGKRPTKRQLKAATPSTTTVSSSQR
jgi:hypothetical protein